MPSGKIARLALIERDSPSRQTVRTQGMFLQLINRPQSRYAGQYFSTVSTLLTSGNEPKIPYTAAKGDRREARARHLCRDRCDPECVRRSWLACRNLRPSESALVQRRGMKWRTSPSSVRALNTQSDSLLLRGGRTSRCRKSGPLIPAKKSLRGERRLFGLSSRATMHPGLQQHRRHQAMSLSRGEGWPTSGERLGWAR